MSPCKKCNWPSFFFAFGLNASATISFALTYLTFDIALRSMIGDKKQYPSNIYDIKLNGQQPVFIFLITVACLNFVALIMDGALMFFRYQDHSLWIKRIGVFLFLFCFLSSLTITIPGAHLVTKLHNAEQDPSMLSGNPFLPFKQLADLLKFNASKQEHLLTFQESQEIGNLQDVVDTLQESNKCCGIDSWEFWVPLTVTDQTRVPVRIAEKNRFADVWWRDCFRRKTACLIPQSCCPKTHKRKAAYQCNLADENSSDEKPRDVYNIGCKQGFAGHLRQFVTTILFMQAGIFIITTVASAMSVISAAKTEVAMDRYLSRSHYKEFVAQVYEENAENDIKIMKL